MKTKSQMDGRTGGGGGEYFICFTARPSSSSASCATVMRVPSSKSLMSPGRGGRDAAATAPSSLSASLSRRLRSSGSVKGLQSPMFPSGAGTGGRRKGCGFEAAEPSSPKVTCIGQVRVKTKKKKRAQSSSAAAIAAVARSRSQRSVEASFRDHRELRSSGANWVQQIPVSICEALRALGDFNCFLPCSGRSFCSSSSSKEDADANRQKVSTEDKGSSCGAVLARWLMSVHESEEGKRSEVVGLVVGDGCLEKSLAEELQEKKSMAAAAAGDEDEEEDAAAARVSVCIPPKNALLLMRCRSDPVKMAALATRFWDSPAMRADNVVQEENPAADAAVHDYDDNGGGDEGNEEDVSDKLSVHDEESAVALVEESIASAASSATAAEKAVEELLVDEENEGDDDVNDESVANPSPAKFAENTDTVSTVVPEQEEEEVLKGDNEVVGEQDDPPLMEGEKEELDGNTARSPSSCSSSSTPTTSCRQKLDSRVTGGGRSSCSGLSKARERNCMRRSLSTKEKERRRYSFSSEKEARRHSFSAYPEAAARRSSFSVDTAARRRWSFSVVKDEQQQVAPPTEAETEEDKESCMTESATEPTQANGEGGGGGDGDLRSPKLPDCLLLMMYEPKLSMEVSKETWVCSTDFLHWRPHQNNKDNTTEKTMAEKQQQQQSVDPLPPPVRPPLPAATMAVTAKVVPAPAMPPAMVLTRCKSEPMRASARLAPVDACFWKSRHQPIGAIGF